MKKLLRLLFLSVIMFSAVNLFAQNVYTNKADSKYHLLSCKYLDPSHDSLDIAIAIKKGLNPCSVCKPTTQSASSGGSMGSSGSMSGSGSMNSGKSMGKSGMNQQGTSSTNVAEKQCIFINKDGKRCEGSAEPGSDYCWDHRNVKK
jgi:hypothetical protein